jgi:hypothetical protein
MHGDAWGRRVGRFLMALLLAAITGVAVASETPYFQVIGADATRIERLPLLQTQADVDIAGTIAAVELRQTFENRGNVGDEHAAAECPAGTVGPSG